MKLFKKGIEYNKLATNLNSTYIMLNEIEVKIKNSINNDFSDFEQDLYILAYLGRKQIIERIETYNWSMMSPIIVPMLSKGGVSLTFAFEQTIGRLQKFSEQIGFARIVNDILEKGKSYYEIERSIPLHMRNNLS